jgi:hypothetical protein
MIDAEYVLEERVENYAPNELEGDGGEEGQGAEPRSEIMEIPRELDEEGNLLERFANRDLQVQLGVQVEDIDGGGVMNLEGELEVMESDEGAETREVSDAEESVDGDGEE